MHNMSFAKQIPFFLTLKEWKPPINPYGGSQEIARIVSRIEVLEVKMYSKGQTLLHHRDPE